MKQPLSNRIEKFLSNSSIISFAYREEPAIISFLFDEKDLSVFNNKKNHEDLRDYFRGRKLKLIIYTPDNVETIISLVDIETADTIKIDGPKFVANNIALFCEAKLPENTIFFINMMGNGKTPKGEKAIGLHPYWLDKKPLQIHGYSIIDKRET